MKWFRENFILLLIIIQPILDVIAFFALNTKYSIISFFLRSFTLFVLLLLVIYVFFSKKANKEDGKYIKYIFAILIFGICHFLNTILTSNISIIEDIKEFVRVFYMPIVVCSLCVLIKDKKETSNKIILGIKINMLQIFIIILLGFITGNVVHTYAEGVGLRGWFYNSNSQSVILCFIVPLSLYYVFKSEKKYKIALFSIISFFLLYSNGTTGCYLLLIPTFGILIYDILLSNMKRTKKIFNIMLYLIPIFCTIFLYKYSPDYKITQISNGSLKETKNENTIIKDKIKDDVTGGKNSNKESKNEIPSSKIDSVVERTYQEQLIDHYFNHDFIEKYGYPTILKKIGKDMSADKLVDNRFRKKIVASIIFENSNFTTKMLGFEFSEIKQYDIDLESDYSAIMYYYGYIGIMIYLTLIIYVFAILILNIIKNPKKILDSEFVLISSMYLMLNMFAELSGSLLKRPNASIYLALIILIIIFKYSEGIGKFEKK